MTYERLTYPREIELPGDEGVFARSALVACLTDDECRLVNVPDTAPGDAVLEFLSGMGYVIDKIDDWQVNLTGRGYAKPDEPIDAVDCAANADIAHLFAAYLAGFGMYGSIRCAYPYHSLKDLADLVRSLGGEILGRGEGCAPPWCVHPAPLSTREIKPMHPHPSLRSCLGIIFLLGQGTGAFPANTPGYDSLERAVRHYRGDIRRSEGRLYIKGGERVLARRREIPRSFRLAVAITIAAALTSAKPVHLPGVYLNPTRAATLEFLGRSGVDFTIEKIHDLDEEIAGDVLVNPSKLHGVELGKEAVRSVYEDIGPLLVMAALSAGLSEFDLGHLAQPEAEGAIKLANEITIAAKAGCDSSGNLITIEGNPSPQADDSAIEAVSDYTARVILSLVFKTPKPLEKGRCIRELGKALTQVILGDLLF